MSFYIFSISKDNWEIVKKENVMGFQGKNTSSLFKKIEIKDKCVFFITRISGFSGIFTVSSKDVQKKIRWSIGNYHFLVKIEPIIVLENPIKIKNHINNLDFITNKANWGSHLRAPKKISEKDFNYITNLFEKSK